MSKETWLSISFSNHAALYHPLSLVRSDPLPTGGEGAGLNPGLDEAPARLLKSSTICLTEDPEDGLFVVVAARAVFDPEIGTLDLTQLVRDRVHSEADLQDPVIFQRKANYCSVLSGFSSPPNTTVWGGRLSKRFCLRSV